MRRILSLVTSVLVVMTSIAHAQPGPEELLTQKIAVWRFDALGIEAELVARLETLFRMELDRLAKQPMPSRRDIERVISADQRECTGEEKCLAAIGKKLGVDVVVTGTVGSMADSYVLNIKAVESSTGKQIQRIQSDPLRGSPDDLIEGVRVAAYRLLAPEQLHGSIQIQSDLVGAEVQLDGKAIGKTPLPRLGVIAKQGLGKHKLRVQAAGYSPFEDDVDVHFQKVSQVVVRLLPSTEVIGTGKFSRVEKRPFYTRTWFIVGVGIAAIALGAVIGNAVGSVKCVDGTTGSEIDC
ncbi:MAG TPA: PEGA domain-containing protein [Kofleriaceae bacterium]